jgi:hypothetical protein
MADFEFLENILEPTKRQAIKALTPEQLRIIRTLQNMGRKYAPNFQLGEGSPLKFVDDSAKAIKNYLAPYQKPINFKLGEGGPIKSATKQVVNKALPAVKKVAPELDSIFTGSGNKFASELGNVSKAGAKGLGFVGGLLGAGAIASGEQARKVAGYLKSLGEYGAVADQNKSPKQIVKDFNSLYFGKRQGAEDAPLRTMMEKAGLYNAPKAAVATPKQTPNDGLPILPPDSLPGDGSGLPAVPNVPPIGDVVPIEGFGSLPPVDPMVNNISTYTPAADNNGMVVTSTRGNGVNYTPGNGRLGDQLLGGVYVEPTQYSGVASPQRIQNYLDTFNMSPKEFNEAYLKDAQRAGFQAILNRDTNTNVAPYSELARNQALQNYLAGGYNAEASINEAERNLADAYALSYQTGLPVSITSSPDKMLQYVYSPLLKGTEERKTLASMLNNDLAVQALKNEATRYQTDKDYNAKMVGYLSDMQKAKMTNDTKLLSTALTTAILDPAMTAQDVFSIASKNLSPELANQVTAISAGVRRGTRPAMSPEQMQNYVGRLLGNPYGQ